MRAAESPRPRRRLHRKLLPALLLPLLLSIPVSATAGGTTQLLLSREHHAERTTEYTGAVDLAVDPGLENARVSIVIDGQKIADRLPAPFHVNADFGPVPVEHRITITAVSGGGQRVQWQEVINRGNLPLTVKVALSRPGTREFDVETTAPKDDPIEVVQLWDGGRAIASTTQPPYHFSVPEGVLARGTVQVTARTRSGEEAADFWSDGLPIHAEELQVRTVPIFVSVVDRNGQTRDDVDRSHFRILDNESEGKIIEFGKAFDQPISIALLVDASTSMTYSIQHAAKAAAEFVTRAIKEGDRCSVTAIQEVPRRRRPLTDDRMLVAEALEGIRPQGQTALYDAIASAIRELREEKNRRAIVVLTDGDDNASLYSYADVQKMASEAAIPIYFVAYEGGSNDARDLDRLRYLSSETGGFVAAATGQNLRAKYNEIEKDLRAQFAITYQITDFGRSNEWRRVRVVLDSPRLTARTIRGYFAP